MARKIIRWTKRANRQFDAIILYYSDNYSEQATRTLVSTVYDRIDVLAVHPYIGRRTPTTKTVREVLVNRNLKLYYRLHGKVLIVTAFFSNKQHPDSNPYA